MYIVTLNNILFSFLVLINLEEVKEDWKQSSGYHLKTIADHYGVYEHLFGEAFFIPRVPLDVNYVCQDCKIPVYSGNIIKPSEAIQKPEVKFKSESGNLWSLILTNPDGHLSKQNSEYVHWFVYVVLLIHLFFPTLTLYFN